MVNPQAARQQIDDRLQHLRSTRFEELEKLPPFAIEDIPFGSENWSLTTYRQFEKGGLRIVVQIGPPQPKFLLVHVQADGFRMSRDGAIAPLSDRELDEFK
ncbi:MAG: hypothetical protein ABR585_10420 [Gemmatimonadaceae bacterium]